MHNLGFVHNDLKLDNILIGNKDSSKIHLIDFGLSQSFYDPNGKHIEKMNLDKFSGNFMFASLNSCRGNNKSRRDDVQSIMLIMIFLLNENKLPWSNFNSKFKDQDKSFSDYLGERLEIQYVRQLFKMVPKSFRSVLKEILVLTFDQKPKYDYYIDKIKVEMMKEVQIGKDLQPKTHVFEWNLN